MTNVVKIKAPESHYVLLSIGTNLGDRKKYIERAVELLKYSGVVNDIEISSYYETEPVGFEDQPWFLNIALSGKTTMPPVILLQLLKSIEYMTGREVRDKWHEREIDIDILLYEDISIESNILQVPHPRMHERRFVLIPAVEIAKDRLHPALNLTVDELLDKCEDDSAVNICN